MSTDIARAELQQAVLVHLAATLNTLSTDQLRALAEGRGRLVFSSGVTGADVPGPDVARSGTVRPDVTSTGAMRAIAHRPAARPASRPQPVPVPGLEEDVAAIRALTTPDDVRGYLASRRFTVPVLRQLARALGPTVPASGRNRAELVHGIVEGTVGFRARSRALSGGAWG